MFRDKANNNLGAVYLESCMINSYSTNLSAGQNVMMENVSGLADRLFSVRATETQSGFPTGSGATQVPGSLSSEQLTTAVFGPGDSTSNDGIQA